MGASVPGSLQTQTRTPLDGKYWIQNFSQINNGLTFQGLMRFDKGTDKLWIKLTGGWVEIVTGDQGIAGTITIGDVTSGLIPSITNTGTDANAILDFVLPKGDAGTPATIAINSIETSPDEYAHVQNVGTVNDAQFVIQLPRGLQGLQGRMFTIDAQGAFATRSIYNGEDPEFTFLDENGLVYVMQENGTWSTGIPFQGPKGDSIWVAYSAFSNGNTPSYTLNISHKFVSFLKATEQPDLADFSTWVLFKGEDGGPAGDSAYTTWLSLGNSGTEEEFVDSLKGSNGLSAYQIWLNLGNVGTEAQFIDSLSNTAGLDQDIVDALEAATTPSLTNPYATQEYVDTISEEYYQTVLDGSSGIFDSFGKIAIILNNDPDIVATLTNLINLRAPIASPTFTGVPITTTPSTSDNSTKIASTAFVRSAITTYGAGSLTGLFKGAFSTGGAYAVNDLVINPSGALRYANTSVSAGSYSDSQWTDPATNKKNQETNSSVSQTAGVPVALDFSGADVVNITLSANVTFSNASNKARNKPIRATIFNNTAGTLTFTFPSSWKFPNATAPTSIAAGKYAILTIECMTGTAETDVFAGYLLF